MRRAIQRTMALGCLGGACVVGAMTPHAGAQETRPGAREHGLDAGLNFAIDALKQEARQSQHEGNLARTTPNYAADYGGQLPHELLNARLTQRLDADAFIDAYVRWQLISFAPQLPHLGYADFDKMLEELPALLPNPRAAEQMMTELDALAKAGPLSAEQKAKATELLQGLEEQSRRVESLNRPAREFRAWVRSQLPETGRRAMLAQIEACAADVAAGYPINESRARLLDMCIASAVEPAFERSDRGEVMRRLRLLTGTKRVHLASAALVDGGLKVELGVSAIYDRDIRPCMRLLDKPPRQP